LAFKSVHVQIEVTNLQCSYTWVHQEFPRILAPKGRDGTSGSCQCYVGPCFSKDGLNGNPSGRLCWRLSAKRPFCDFISLVRSGTNKIQLLYDRISRVSGRKVTLGTPVLYQWSYSCLGRWKRDCLSRSLKCPIQDLGWIM
jgi:hypothetical protein